eukprot:529186-Prymnesium_polylepis.1
MELVHLKVTIARGGRTTRIEREGRHRRGGLHWAALGLGGAWRRAVRDAGRAKAIDIRLLANARLVVVALLLHRLFVVERLL